MCCVVVFVGLLFCCVARVFVGLWFCCAAGMFWFAMLRVCVVVLLACWFVMLMAACLRACLFACLLVCVCV